MSRLVHIMLGFLLMASLTSATEMPSPRCQIVPLPGNQVSLRIDGLEKARWHFSAEYPRPFFFPFNGPSGKSLTRMGHPGAPNHDHHRSIWFAHHDVAGTDFWSDTTRGRLKQKQWYCYEEGDEECVMACLCGWYDGAGAELMESDVFAALRPADGEEHMLDVQLTLRPAPGRETVELGKTNFGFFAVRVARSLSVHFGGGKLTNSEEAKGEEAIFGKPARWVDYSGPVTVGLGKHRRRVLEGITYFDHPRNPRYPTQWHVREDGWMGASFCMRNGFVITKDEPLTLRYLLHAHSGLYDPRKAQNLHASFGQRPGFRISRSTRPHRQFEVERIRQPAGTK